MIFVEWWAVEKVCFVVLVIAIAVGLFISVRHRRAWLRFPVQLLTLLIGLGTVAIVLFAAVLLPNPDRYSEPIYSPNHKLAARIAEYNAGGLGGADTQVELFSHRGFVSHRVYEGEFRSVDSAHIAWMATQS
jgi:hypothetical protein